MVESIDTESHDIYQEDFEGPFFETTREYYAKKRQEWIRSIDSAVDYLEMIKLAFKGESVRVLDYLNQSSEGKILKFCREELLEKTMPALVNKEGDCTHTLQVLDAKFGCSPSGN